MDDKIANMHFIQLLSDYVSGRKSTNISVTPAVIALAKAHQVAPIIYYQTKEQALYASYLQTISSYTRRENLFKQISESIQEFPFYTVKGFSISHYYPIPQLRTMSDCDIIVHEKDKEHIRQIMLSMGFADQTGIWNTAEWHLQKQGLDFEIHHRLLYDEIANTNNEKTFADTAWEYVHGNELDESFHFVFLIIHLKKHFVNCGVGIRQFMDLAVMSKSANLNPDKISAFLHQVNLQKFAGLCSALCLRWFGVALPIDTPDISDEFYEYATDMILSNGVFGFALSENAKKSILNNVEKRGKTRILARMLLPSYKVCCMIPRYKWINGKPFLLPVLWIYRILWALFNSKGKHSAEYAAAVLSSDKALIEWNRELEIWGIR